VNLVLLDARVGSCLRRRQAEKHRLEQYFSRELAGELACGNENLLQTRDANVSILFCDIRRFSSISERVGARTTIEWIGSTMGELSRIVFREQGVLIDFTGDGLMAMWGAPKTLENHADLAVGAALSMLDALHELNNLWASRLNERFQLGIGINSGSAQVGVIGSSPKFKYGPLGATVNLASRVEGTTKYLRAPLVVTQHTKNQLQDRKKYSIRRLCRAKVVNMQQPVSLYEIHRFDKNLTPLFKTYQCALRFYENREFQSAARVLGRSLATYEELSDVPSQMLMARVLSAMSDVSRFEPVWEFGK
jgi:adenylate cyclase